MMLFRRNAGVPKWPKGRDLRTISKRIIVLNLSGRGKLSDPVA